MLKNKLESFSRSIATAKDTEKSGKQKNRYRDIADFLQGEIKELAGGSFIKIMTDFDEYYAHGQKTIEDLQSLSAPKRIFFGESEESLTVNPEKMLFFDMETTGLGGAGVVPFLIGLGSVTNNGFQVRQYFLPDYPDEEAMLEAVRTEIKDDTILVSYNGKSFDLPILIDRLIIHRVERNLRFADHIDLLHSARRLYRRRLKDCTLKNIEREVLDFYRIDDTPGYLVPSIYFDWLNSGNTADLGGVVEHNLYDIVSLYFILFQVAAVQTEPESQISDPDDILSLVKIHERRREYKKICQTLENFDDLILGSDRYDILFLKSMSHKRDGQFESAAALWNKIAEVATKEAYICNIELAKYYEHKIKDYKKALIYTNSAREKCPSKAAEKEAITKRINRLTTKINSLSDSK